MSKKLKRKNNYKVDKQNNLKLNNNAKDNEELTQSQSKLNSQDITPKDTLKQNANDLPTIDIDNASTATLNNEPTQNQSLYTLIKNSNKPILYNIQNNRVKNLKPTHNKSKFKLSVKSKINNELFSTYSSIEERNKQKKIAEEIAKDAEQKAKQQKSKKSRILSLIFLIINVVIIVVAIAISASKEEGMVSITQMFEVANLWYLLLAFIAFILLMSFESLRYYILIWKSTRHSRPFLSYKVAAIGKYYDNITPLSTGGQPMQIYYLKKRGVRASTASTMPFAIYIFNHMITFIISVCVLIFSEKIAGGLSKGVYSAAIVGIVINTSIMLFVFVLSFSKTVGPIVTIGILKLLFKMRIIKDYTSLYRKVMRFVGEYQKTFRYFVSNIPNFFMMAGSTLLVICTRYAIPTFVVCMFNEGGFSFEIYSAVFIWCVLIEAVLSYIPWPGAGGVAEVTYTTMFAYFALSSGTTLWAMLIYRIFQYYIYLLQGLGVICYDFFVGNKKIQSNNDRLKKIEEERRQKKLAKIQTYKDK